jgi:hypothetical protein
MAGRLGKAIMDDKQQLIPLTNRINKTNEKVYFIHRLTDR